MKLSLMVAISKNGVIGNGPDIPWSAKGEQLLFKAITYNQWLLVGRKTFESMGALPNRKYAVVTRSSFTSDNENVVIFPSIKDALTNLKKITDHVIVSGGGEIYKSLIDQVDTLHISTIDIEPEGDVYFPEIPSNFRPVFTQDFASNINYSYQIWQRVNKWQQRIRKPVTPFVPKAAPVCDPLCQALNIMREAVIAEVSTQLSEVVGVIERHLEPTLLAVHLYGSAVDGGLKPHSDIDLLVTVTVRLDETTRRALINDLWKLRLPGESEILRAVEVTIVVHDDIIPWRYPAKRELQFGEWQRNDILAGIFEPATIDIDLAILLTKAREHSVALVGPAAEELFDPVPEQDLFEALNETLTLWNSPPDWAGDERNVVLTLSRIWYSAVTGRIAPKDVAADWAMERLPAQYQPVILEARQAYLGQEEDRLASRADQLKNLFTT